MVESSFCCAADRKLFKTTVYVIRVGEFRENFVEIYSLLYKFLQGNTNTAMPRNERYITRFSHVLKYGNNNKHNRKYLSEARML
jgi:hypothetical protein